MNSPESNVSRYTVEAELDDDINSEFPAAAIFSTRGTRVIIERRTWEGGLDLAATAARHGLTRSELLDFRLLAIDLQWRHRNWMCETEDPDEDFSDCSDAAMRPALLRVPGASLDGFLKNLLGKRVYVRLLEQHQVDDMEEWQEAHIANNPWLAKWIHVRCWIIMLWTAFGALPFEKLYGLLTGGWAGGKRKKKSD